MPNNNDALIKDIKRSIKDINKRMGTKFSYEDMYDDIGIIMRIENQTMKDQEFIGYYTRGIFTLSDKMLTRRSVIMSHPLLTEKYKDDPALQYSISEASDTMNSLISRIMNIIDPDAARGHVLSKEQLDTISTYQRDAIKDRSYLSEIPKCLKKWDYRCFIEDAEKIDGLFTFNGAADDTYKFNGNENDERDFNAALLYYKVQKIQQELDSHIFLWHWFNFRKVGACNAFIAKANEALQKVGFNSNKHEGKAESILLKRIMPPHHSDFNKIDAERNLRDKQNDVKMQLEKNSSIANYNLNINADDVKKHIQSLNIEETIQQVEAEYYATHSNKQIPENSTNANKGSQVKGK